MSASAIAWNVGEFFGYWVPQIVVAALLIWLFIWLFGGQYKGKSK